MPQLRIITDAQGGFSDLKDRTIIHLSDPILVIGRLPHGMQSGKSSVVVRIDLPNGTTILAETSMELFLACAQTFKTLEDK